MKNTISRKGSLIKKNTERKIVSILKKNGVTKAAIFGSYARGDAKKNSDIDILIEFNSVKSLLDIVRLEFLLARILKRKIDLLTYKGIHPLLKERILKEERRII